MLVLSQYVELGLAMRLLADSAEGVGYLLKDRISDVREFVAAVEKYVSSIFGKLGLPSTGSESRRVLAVLLFLRS